MGLAYSKRKPLRWIIEFEELARTKDRQEECIRIIKKHHLKTLNSMIDIQGFRIPILHFVVYNGLDEVTRYLLESGANPNIQEMEFRYVPIHVAVIDKNEKAFDLLVNYGVDIHVRSFAGYNALHYACMGGSYDLAKKLVKLGININEINQFGDTPFSVSIDVYREVPNRARISSYLLSTRKIDFSIEANQKALSTVDMSYFAKYYISEESFQRRSFLLASRRRFLHTN